MKRCSVEESVGQILAYDITEVNREKGIKKRAYKRGHVIQADEVDHLKSLGRKTVFIEDGEDGGVHEDDAAKMTAPLAAGDNISFDEAPSEGKVGFYADVAGVFKVDEKRLYDINYLGIPSMPTIHNNLGVKKGDSVAAFRIIPLVCEQEIMDKIREILKEPLFYIEPYKVKNCSLLITGSEVYEGIIQDGFRPVIEAKLKKYGVELAEYEIVPDKLDVVRDAVKRLASGADMVITTGGTSVDPDDITSQALADAGVIYEMKGTPLQPGNNFTVGYLDDTPVCAVPAAALHFTATSLDILMPRMLAGEKITKADLAKLAHGGLCHFCKKCVYPICPFGRG